MKSVTKTTGGQLLLTALLLALGQAGHCELVLSHSEAGIFSRDQSGREVVQPTSRVEGRLGTKFGITYTVGNKQAGVNPVKYLYLTPGYTEPGRPRRDKIELARDLAADAGTHTMAFEFTEHWEITYGKWILMVFEGDRLLTSAEFDIVSPEESLD